MLVLVLRVGAIHAQDSTPEPTPEATISAENALIMQTVRAAVATVDTIFMADGDKRLIDVDITVDQTAYTITVSYRTEEMSDSAYDAELLDMFRAIGGALQDDQLMGGTLTLIPMVKVSGETLSVEVVSVSGDTLRLFLGHQMNRTTFLLHLIRQPGDHGAPGLRAKSFNQTRKRRL